MKKLFLALCLVLSATVVTYTHVATAGVWDRQVVRHCVESSTVIFVSIDDSGKGYLGSGVVIDSNGLTLTCAHLFRHDPMKRVDMISHNGRRCQVRVLMIDLQRDLALVAPIATAGNFSYAKIQKTNTLWVGEDVLIVGNPEGHFWTVTSGIVSGFIFHPTIFSHSFLTDATVNPGNSGGPAFNSKGEIVGIVSAGYVNMLGQSIGINIVVSIREIHTLLAHYNQANRPYEPIKRYRIGELR